MADEVESWAPDFKPGWPDIIPTGLLLPQILVHPGEESESDEPIVAWAIGPARTNGTAIAFVGDLTVRSSNGFGGAIVVMPLALRDSPDVVTVEYANEVVDQYGDWACSIMYDYAATQLRAAMAGAGLDLELSYTTPKATIQHLPADDEDAAEPPEAE